MLRESSPPAPGSAGGRQKALALAMAQTGTQTGLQAGGQAHLPVRPLKDTPLEAMDSEIISRRDYRRRPSAGRRSVAGGCRRWGGRGRQAGNVGGVRDFDRAAVGCGQLDIGECPVLGVGDGTGAGGLDVEVIELEVDKRRVRIGRDGEGAARASSLDVPDMDVGEVGKALFWRDGCGELDPVVRDGLWIGAWGQRGVRVVGVPVHGHADGNADAGESDVMDADIGGIAAAHPGGLEENSAADSCLGGEVPGLDVVEAAGSLTETQIPPGSETAD